MHLQALVVLPASRAFTMTVFGGPTYFTVKQGLVTDVRFTQSYPYETAAFAATSTGQQTGSKLGFNVGADVAYYFSNYVGVGWLMVQRRHDRTSVGWRRHGQRPSGRPARGGRACASGSESTRSKKTWKGEYRE